MWTLYETKKERWKVKKFLLLLILGAVLLFPEAIFSGLAGVFIIFMVIFIVVEIGLDIYIVIALFFKKDKKKK